MNATHPPISLAERPDLILAGVREVAAARSGRGGLVGPLIALLYGRLARRGRRFAALLAAFRAGTLRAPRPRAVRLSRPVRPEQPRLPEGFGWLIRLCGWQAASYGSQLKQLMAEPEMTALLRAVPQAGRVFRPLCRMLAVELPPELALKPRRRTRRAASPGAGALRAGLSCYQWRVISVAAEPQAAPSDAAEPLVIRARGRASHDATAEFPHLTPTLSARGRRGSSTRTSACPREEVGRGADPPGEADESEPA